MLQAATVLPTVKPLVYRQSSDMSRPAVSVELINSRITLNISVPSPQRNGKEIFITGGISARLSQRDGAVFSVIQEMIEWIEGHLDQELSVVKISNKSGYSVWHFQRKFVQLLGLNVYEYVRIRRVINATFILIRTKRGILDVAVDSGFNCQASFTRTVRGITGYTPAVIRKQFSGDEQRWFAIIESLINPQMNYLAGDNGELSE